MALPCLPEKTQNELPPLQIVYGNGFVPSSKCCLNLLTSQVTFGERYLQHLFMDFQMLLSCSVTQSNLMLVVMGILQLSFSTVLPANLSSKILNPSFRSLNTLSRIFSRACVT